MSFLSSSLNLDCCPGFVVTTTLPRPPSLPADDGDEGEAARDAVAFNIRSDAVQLPLSWIGVFAMQLAKMSSSVGRRPMSV